MPSNVENKARALMLSLFDGDSALELEKDRCGGESGVWAAWGTVDGSPVYAFAQDAELAGGGLGKCGADKIAKVYSLAATTGAPVVGIYDSCGLRLGEGAGAFSGLGEIMRAVNNLSGVVPQISVVTGVCGGAMAMMASCADILIMSADAELFLTPPDIIRAKDASAVVGTAAVAASNGTAAFVADDAALAIEKARQVLAYLPSNNLDVAPVMDFSEPSLAGDFADEGSFVELYAGEKDCVKVGFATVAGQGVGVVCFDDGESGAICSCGVRKAARFVRLCDAYSLPIITVLDSCGFAACAKDEAGGAYALAGKLAMAYAEATTAKIAVVKGMGIGSLYIAAAGKNSGADMVVALEGAVISPIGIEAAVLVNWGDRLDACTDEQARKALFAEYAAGEASAFAAAAAGTVDSVVPAGELRGAVLAGLAMLSGKRDTRLPKKHGLAAF